MRGLVLLVLIAAGCTTVPPEQRESMEYERIDARLKATEKFNAMRSGCRAAGGIVVVEGSGSRLPRSSLEMKTARCVERPRGVAF